MGLLKTLSNIVRSKKMEAEEALKNPERDIKIAIVDSKKQAADFQTKISDLNRQKKMLEKQYDEKKDQVKKYEKMATAALEAENEEDATTLVEKQLRFDTEAKSLKQQIEIISKDLQSARKQLQAMQKKISDAEMNEGRLKMRLESAKVRESLAKAQSTINSGDNPLSALDDLNKAVDEAEASAEATEEEVGMEAGNVEASLEEKYNGQNSDDAVGEKMAALKAALEKKKAKTA